MSPLGFWLDEVRRQETVRGLSGHFSFFLCVCLTVIGSSSRLPINLLVVVCLEADVSPSSGIRVPVCVCFGSDADVSPVIGIQVPSLPVFVCVLFGVHEPNYGSSDSHSR